MRTRPGKMSKRLKGVLLANKRRNWLEYHMKRQDYRCYWCSLILPSEGTWKSELTPTCDHIIPTSRGGEDTCENTCAAHKRCNEAKGDLLPEEFCAPGTFVYSDWFRRNRLVATQTSALATHC